MGLSSRVDAVNGMTTFSYAICANVSCHNGGTCVPKSTTQFFCFCASGWTGYLCDDGNDVEFKLGYCTIILACH